MKEILQIASAVTSKARAQAHSIKNRGRLNPRYEYFAVRTEGAKLDRILNSSTELSNDSSIKYLTVAADVAVFNATCSHVLMVFRCPHSKLHGRICNDNILDTDSFQYKGCLATPGGFFDSNHDLVKVDGKDVPDFTLTATRELSEECKLLSSAAEIQTSKPTFVSAEFNNFRDIRWFTSKNYVPTCAVQFASILNSAADATPLPMIKGDDDACGNAYWIDVRIAQYVYDHNKPLLDSFENEYSEETFMRFIKNAEYFVMGENSKLPRNKLKSENVLLMDLKDTEYVVDFKEGVEYQISDFAFDHVANIVRARDVLLGQREQTQ